MTDEEIVKALRCCDDGFCDECAYKPKFFHCKEDLCHDALSLINRQKAEIERMKAENEKAKSYLAICLDEYVKTKIAKESLENTIKNARAETIKEFADKLKEHLCSYDLPNYHYFRAVDEDVIDDLVEGMEGENDNDVYL